MIIEKKKISDLKPAPYNPRKSNEKQEANLKKSLEKFGVVEPIVFNKRTGYIVGGHFRIRELKKLGYKEVDCVIVDLNEDDEKELNIRLNANTGEWNWEILQADWDADTLEDWGLDLPDDFIEEEIPEAKEDNFEIPDEIQTDIVLGDLIEIGEHRLLCGDSTDSDSVAKLMNGEKADMVFTDPPYNVDYSGANGKKIQNDKMSSGDFYQFLFEFYKNATANIKNGGVWYVWHTDNENINFRKAFEENNNKFSECLIWVKNTFALGHLDYHKKHETCLYGWKEGAGHYFTPDRTNTTVIDDKIELKKLSKADMLKMLQEIYSDKTKTTVLYCDKPYRSAEHPTMKPILLIAPLIENSSKKGWIVLDPFLGSGSTMVAAHQLKRKCYGIELDPKYCQVIVDRMIALDDSLIIKINGKEYKQ